MSIKSLFEDIAEAIKTKGGTSTALTPAEMPRAILDLPTGSSTASGVTYDNTASGLTANNVQDAIDELAEDVSTISSDLSELLTPQILASATADGVKTRAQLVYVLRSALDTFRQTNGIDLMSRLCLVQGIPDGSGGMVMQFEQYNANADQYRFINCTPVYNSNSGAILMDMQQYNIGSTANNCSSIRYRMSANSSAPATNKLEVVDTTSQVWTNNNSIIKLVYNK